jgi:predicted nucleic-acid-binding Zn-ribbon protein
VLIAYLTGEIADLNTYQDKRVHATGQNLSKQFKKTFNHMVIGTLKKKLFQELEHVSDVTRVDVGQIITAQLSNHT